MEKMVQDIQDMEKRIQDMENDPKNRADEIERKVIAIKSCMRIIRSNANPQTIENAIVKRLEDIEANHTLLKTEVEADIKRLRENINIMKEKDSLLTKYKEEKKTLVKARDALIAVRTKMTDRLDALHNGSFTVVPILVALSAFFYVNRPPPGETLKVWELSGRVVLVILIISGALSFLGQIWNKKKNIAEEINDSDDRFDDFGVWFEGLSKTRADRDAEMSPNLQPNADWNDILKPDMVRSILQPKLELFYPNADRYDNLKPEDLITSSEVRIFKTRGKNQSIGSTGTYLLIMAAVAIVSAIIMVVMCVIQFYVPTPLPKCGYETKDSKFPTINS